MQLLSRLGSTRRSRKNWLRLPILSALLINGCGTLTPCDPQLVEQTCRVSPPNQCLVDGCTLAPDFDFGYCCNEHDALYWMGGTRNERIQADVHFRDCISSLGYTVLPILYYYGVRLGGTPHLPTPWRWGFGWAYPRSYDLECDAEASETKACQRKQRFVYSLDHPCSVLGTSSSTNRNNPL